jgi:hypothetical protein
MDALEILIKLVRKHDRLEHFRRTNSAEYPPSTLIIAFVPRTEEAERGLYHPEIRRIDIYRYGATDAYEDRPAAELAASSPCPIQELVSLAHELGHHECSLLGLPCVYDKARRLETYEGEVGAWMLGRAILEAHLFTDWGTFDEQEHASLLGYREGLHLSDNEANEIQARVARRLGTRQPTHVLEPDRAPAVLHPLPCDDGSDAR